MCKMDMDIVEQERLVDQRHLPEELVIVRGTPIDGRMSQSALWSTVPKAANTGTDLVVDSMLSSVLRATTSLKCCKYIFIPVIIENTVCIVLQYCITLGHFFKLKM